VGVTNVIKADRDTLRAVLSPLKVAHGVPTNQTQTDVIQPAHSPLGWAVPSPTSPSVIGRKSMAEMKPNREREQVKSEKGRPID